MLLVGVKTAVGVKAMFTNNAGDFNTAMGYYALYGSSVGIQNVAIGAQALNNSANNANVAVGFQALIDNGDGQGNTGIGWKAGTSTTVLNNATALGASSIVNASNKVRLGNSAVTVVEGQVAYTYPSDGRFKKDVTTSNVPGLSFILGLKPVAYHFDYPGFSKFLGEKGMDEAQLTARSQQEEIGLHCAGCRKIGQRKWSGVQWCPCSGK